jgi:hypothetical protein
MMLASAEKPCSSYPCRLFLGGLAAKVYSMDAQVRGIAQAAECAIQWPIGPDKPARVLLRLSPRAARESGRCVVPNCRVRLLGTGKPSEMCGRRMGS